MRFAVDRWIDEAGALDEAGASMTYVQANANLSPGEAPQTAESWAQMQAAESTILDAAQNGVSSDPNEQGKLAFGIAMGIAAYAAPPFAALMAGLYAAAQAIAPELYDIGLLDRPHCTRTGARVTPASWGTPIQTTSPGIPAALWPIVADQLSRAYNCESSIPSALVYEAFQGIWNKAHAPTVNVAIAVIPWGPAFAGLGPADIQSAIPFFGMPWDESLWRYTRMSQSDQLSMRYQIQRGALVELDLNNGPVLPGHGETSSPTAYHGMLTSSRAPSAPSSAGKTAAVVGLGALGAVALFKPALMASWLRRVGIHV